MHWPPGRAHISRLTIYCRLLFGDQPSLLVRNSSVHPLVDVDFVAIAFGPVFGECEPV